jgi:phage/plasmid-associated DNA primase
MSDFPFTWIRWYNDAEGGKIACVSGAYEDLPFGSRSDREFRAEGKPPHPEYGQFQWGIACSKTSRTIVIDIDHRDQWVIGDTYIELGELADVATSVREDGQRAHTVLTVPEELLHLWPKQGPTVWGDVKSNGFSYIEGQHKSGMHYLDLDREPVEATAEILEALTRDRIFPQHGREGTGQSGMAGPWEDDSYEITSHDECLSVVCSMVRAGLTEEEIYARLAVIMPNRDGEWRGRDAYIAEKIRSAQSKSEKWDREEMAVWENWSGLPYDQLSTIVLANEAERLRPKSVEEVQHEAAELAEHAVAIGEPLTDLTVAQRLNPAGYPFEPQAMNDTVLGTTVRDFAVVNFRITADEGCWLENTGTHWERWGTKSERLERAATIVMSLAQFLKTDSQLKEEIEAAGTTATQEDIDGDDKRKERLVKTRNKFLGTSGQNAIGNALIKSFLADNRYSVRVSELDAEPDVLWAGGQPWSLSHPSLTFASDYRRVNPVHLKTALCAPQPGPTPAFDRLLEAIWPDPEIRAWALREMAGVLLWGATSKMHPVLDGPPQGGKSTFALILKTVLGTYAVQVSPDKILGGDSSSTAEEEIAAMMGARMVWMDEPPPAGKQAISRFNDLASGTGDLSAARKYSNRVSAPKLFNFLICQNPRNALRMDAQGVAERITHIPCDGTPAATLAARENWLRNGEPEYPAILARLIYECGMYRTDNRWPVPHAVVMSRDSAQVRSDEFGAWLLENFDQFPSDIKTTDNRLTNSPTINVLRTQYNDQHARANGLPRIGSSEVRDQLKRLEIRCTTAGGEGNSRRMNVVFVQAKPVGMFAR